MRTFGRLHAFATAVSEDLHRFLIAVADADKALARGILEAKPELRRLERVE